MKIAQVARRLPGDRRSMVHSGQHVEVPAIEPPALRHQNTFRSVAPNRKHSRADRDRRSTLLGTSSW